MISFLKELRVFDLFCFRLNIFASKIKNLPISLGTEGQRPQILICVFLMTYISIFFAVAVVVVVVVVVVAVVDFPLFSASKDFIRDSQRL